MVIKRYIIRVDKYCVKVRIDLNGLRSVKSRLDPRIRLRSHSSNSVKSGYSLYHRDRIRFRDGVILYSKVKRDRALG